jgi:ribosomal protein S12 methylthiotransferase
MVQHFKIITLGCPKNTVDSEQIQGFLCQTGLIAVEDLAKAEIIIVNTCGFIESAKQESINTVIELGQYKKTGICKYLIMAGCLVQKYASELKEALPEVDLFLGTGDLPELPHLLSTINKNNTTIQVTQPEKYLYEDSIKRDFSNIRPYAYVKIAEGCNNCCTYCVIPQLKGSYRSRTIPAILQEVNELVRHGVKEIILIAQDTTSYGIDLAGKELLPQLLRELSQIPHLSWIRLLYCYPDYLTEELLLTIKNEEKICKYLDIPLQHIADPILEAMGRSMNKVKIIELLKKIRKMIPEITLRSTFIVGFPRETQECYNELLAFLQEMKFDRAGFFAYSREPGTVASLLPGQISEREKRKRVEKATFLQEKILSEKQAQLVNQKLEIIVDGKSLDYEGLWEGRTRGDAPEIDGIVYFKANPRVHPGEIIKIQITHSQKYALIGEVCDESGQ